MSRKFTLEEYPKHFWSKIDVRGIDDCWNWMAGLTNGEYGCVGFMGKIYRAHQVAFYLVNGRFAVGDLHQLKERPPEIWLRNENHGRAKLKREDVVNIRHLYT